VLALTVAPARETRQVVDLTLRVPPQMLVRFGGMPGSANLEAHGVAALELDGVVGDVQAADIGGHVSGTHRNGSLTLTNARDVTLTLVASNATFTGVTGTLSLTARNGETHVERSAAQTTIDATNQKVVVTEPGGPVRLTGSGGELVVDRPLRETHVDVRRMAATITIAAAVPVSVITSDAPVHLALVGEPAVAIDAIATDGGHVTAADFDAEAASVDQSSRIAHVIAGGTTRVVLRNARGDIEITRGK
jgi:hypothetical protein